MNGPFRKLIRISAVLVALVLLFDFFGYYFTRVNSAQNTTFIALLSTSTSQQTLSQQISRDVMIVLDGETKQSERNKLNINLRQLLETFKSQQDLITRDITINGFPAHENIPSSTV